MENTKQASDDLAKRLQEGDKLRMISAALDTIKELDGKRKKN